MLKISNTVDIPLGEINFSAIRAQGAGGQNVNKVSSAIHLRFDVNTSSLPQSYKARLLSKPDHRITQDGIIIIKAQRYRTQELNKQDALERLAKLIQSFSRTPKPRRPTKPTKASQRKRLDRKVKKGRLKKLRNTIAP